MKRIALALGLWLAASAAFAQQVVNPAPNAGVYGAYNSGAQTCVTGTGCWLQTDINGLLKITGTVTVIPSGTQNVAITSPLGGGTQAAAVRTTLATDSPGIIALGPAADTSAIPVVPTPTSNANSGITPVVGGSAVSSLVLKNAAGNLYSVYANCTAACWLMVFNATSAPSNGATTAGNAASNMVECVPIGAGSIGGVNYGLGPPAAYSTGITATISSTACATLTLSTVGFIHGMVK